MPELEQDYVPEGRLTAEWDIPLQCIMKTTYIISRSGFGDYLVTGRRLY